MLTTDAPTVPDPSTRPDPVRSTAFRRLWVSAAVTQLGDGIGAVAVPLLAAVLTRDPVLIGGLTAAQFVPWLLFALPVGVLVDRVDRRSAMVAANLVRGLALAAMVAAMAADAVSIWLLYGLVLVLGTAETVYDTATQASVPALVGDRAADLDRANGRIQGAVTVAQNFLGVPVAGLLFAVAATLPFGVTTAAYVVAAAGVARLPKLLARPAASAEVAAGAAAPADARLWQEVQDGVRWLWRHRPLRSLCLVSAVLGFGGQLAQGTIVLFALDVLDLAPAWFGALGVVAAVGALTGSLLAASLAARFGRSRTLFVATALSVLSILAMSAVQHAVTAALVFALLAAGIGAGNVISMSIRQQLVPAEVFGRVHGAWRTLVWGVMPLGGILGGLVAAYGGLRAPWLVAGVLELLLLPVAFVVFRQVDAAAREKAAAS